MAVPVMREQYSLLGGYAMERAGNASALFNTNNVFSDYNKKLNAQRKFAEHKEKEEELTGMFSKKVVNPPAMKPHKQKDKKQVLIEEISSHTYPNEDEENNLMYDELSNSIVNGAVEKGYNSMFKKPMNPRQVWSLVRKKKRKKNTNKNKEEKRTKPLVMNIFKPC